MSNLLTPITINPPDVTIEAIRGKELLIAAEVFYVTDEPSYRRAGELIRIANEGEKAVLERWAEVCALADKTHKLLTGRRAEDAAPFKDARRVLGDRMFAWEMERKRIALLEQQQLEKEAREHAATAQAETAVALEQAGHHDAAEAVMNRPTVPVIAKPAPPPKIEGYSSREVYDFEIVAESQVRRPYCDPSAKKIRAAVAAFGPEAEDMIGGIRVFKTARQSVRRS
jgi:hypothetical protein